MILNCNSCEKKFVVPDHAIMAKGRTVQCGSCGNKWKQFPVNTEVNKIDSDKKIDIRKIPVISKTQKAKKRRVKKTREISLYSPEYLAKKHGISLNDVKDNEATNINKKVSFGFYNSLILFIVFTIAASRCLHFLQDYIVLKLPFTKFYIDYFFENIRNIFEIWKNLISNY
tara:strand:+ start:132 stop:644 length:513 start_codon:yes stop_codon:yes gene_type:complete